MLYLYCHKIPFYDPTGKTLEINAKTYKNLYIHSTCISQLSESLYSFYLHITIIWKMLEVIVEVKYFHVEGSCWRDDMCLELIRWRSFRNQNVTINCYHGLHAPTRISLTYNMCPNIVYLSLVYRGKEKSRNAYTLNVVIFLAWLKEHPPIFGLPITSTNSTHV